MRSASITLVILFASSRIEAQATPATGIQHAIVPVAATNDEWTTTGLTINRGDMLIVRAPGSVTIGAIAGDRDANGVARNSTNPGVNGSLEFKIGVGAGQPAGKFAVHVAEDVGELKFRVRDSDYHDNRGEFVVDVVVLPPSSIPSTSNRDAASLDDSHQIGVIATKSFLRTLVTSEEEYFSDHSRYTNRLADLKHVEIPSGVALKTLSPSADGKSWIATATHSRVPGVICGIGIGVGNPVSSTAVEGEPACR